MDQKHAYKYCLGERGEKGPGDVWEDAGGSSTLTPLFVDARDNRAAPFFTILRGDNIVQGGWLPPPTETEKERPHFEDAGEGWFHMFCGSQIPNFGLRNGTDKFVAMEQCPQRTETAVFALG